MLTITYAEIRRRLGRYLGLGTDPTSWEASEVTAVDDAIKKGLRCFYFPEGEQPHSWSFLRKPVSVALAAGVAWYDLPADFVALESVFSVDDGSVAIEQIDALLLRVKIANEGATGSPLQCSVRSNAGSTGYQVGLYPVPSAVASVECWYIHDPSGISSDIQSPKGGADHSETIAAACLAAAEMELKPESIGEGGGMQYQLFQAKLAQSIARDIRLSRGGAA